MTVQRTYNDAGGTTRSVHMDSRSIGGTGADVPITRDVGGALDHGSSSTGNVFDAKSAAPQTSGDVDVDGFEVAVLRVEASNQSATIKVRPWLKDASGNYTPLPIETVVVTSQQDSASFPTRKTNWFHCQPIEVLTRGAKAMKFQLTQISAGSVSIWLAAR